MAEEVVGATDAEEDDDDEEAGAGAAAPPARQLLAPGRADMTVLSSFTFLPCPLLRNPNVEKATFSPTSRVNGKAAASADEMPSTFCSGVTWAKASASERVPEPSLDASSGETRSRVLLPLSWVSKKNTEVSSHWWREPGTV